jgi:cytochrome P450
MAEFGDHMTAINSVTADGALRPVPARRGWPLVGDSLHFLRDADNYLLGLHARYGEACRVNAFGTRIHFLIGPDANQFVLQSRDGLFANDAWIHFIGPFFHRGLMLLDFDEHRMHRRIMQAAFARDALHGYMRTLRTRVETDLAQWQPGEGVRIFDRLKALTLNVGSEVFAGQPPGAEADAINTAFLDTVQAATGLIRFGLPGTRWQAGLKGRKLLEAHFRRDLAARRADPGSDLFSRLCQATDEDGELFSDEDVVSHMIFVLMAAHDTSTITLSNMIYHLAKHPQWQERLREECRALGDAPMHDEDFEKLGDMSLVMKEALRMCAPVPIMPRRATRDCEFKGMRIPANSTVAISPWATHYLPEVWQDPRRFDPERFAPSRAEDRRHAFQWIPFGGGAHKCIGLHFGEMEVKAILYQLLMRFRWRVPADYVMPQDYTSLPIPKDRLPVRLERLS